MIGRRFTVSTRMVRLEAAIRGAFETASWFACLPEQVDARCTRRSPGLLRDRELWDGVVAWERNVRWLRRTLAMTICELLACSRLAEYQVTSGVCA